MEARLKRRQQIKAAMDVAPPHAPRGLPQVQTPTKGRRETKCLRVTHAGLLVASPRLPRPEVCGRTGPRRRQRGSLVTRSL